MMLLPTGTVTFLFTDIEGSTKLWEAYPEVMKTVLIRHDAVLREAIEQHNGYVFKTVGDAFCGAFATASDALSAALSAQIVLTEEEWGETGPLRVRMGLHTGSAQERDGDYFGPSVNRVARLQSLAYGGQTLLSQSTFELVRDDLPPKAGLRALGLHHLKDLQRAEQVFQLLYPRLPVDFPVLKSLDNLPNNLPQQMTSFVGRGKEMADIKGLLKTSRLLTLLGPGGTGKTRLSVQAGADALDQYPDGAWFIDLAPVTDPARVPQTLAAVLGVREEAGKPAVQTLADYLKTRTLLLILDNCEHLVDVVARIADTLLRACSGLHLLATSREALGIAGETLYRVPTLSLPDPKKNLPAGSDMAAALNQFEAVRLFVDRAVSVSSAFAVTNANAPALAQICYRLDGIPLAIELAAARVRSMPVEQIASRLDDRFRLLTGGSRTALPRQQTLRALIDWGYELLSEQEKAALCRLSVFVGGWNLQAAEAVCADPAPSALLSPDAGAAQIEDWEVVDILTSLADKSLVVYEEEAGEARYRLLETVRQYGLDKLSEHSGLEATRKRHFDFFLSLAADADRQMIGAEEQNHFERLAKEHDNLRAALDWSLADAPTEALELASTLGRFWYIGGTLSEGRGYLERALTGASEDQDKGRRTEALFQLGRLLVEHGDFGQAQTTLEECRALCSETGNASRHAAVLNSLGTMAHHQERYSDARALFEESLSIQRTLGNRDNIASVLSNLGSLAHDLEDYETAQTHYREALVLYQEFENKRGVATVLFNLGNTLYEQNDIAGAQTSLEKSLGIARELKDDWYAAYSLCSMALVRVSQSEFDEAHAQALESLAIVRRVGDKPQTMSALTALGIITSMTGEYEQARLYFRESLDICRELERSLSRARLIEDFARLAAIQSSRSGQPETALRYARRAAALLGAAESLREARSARLSPVSLVDHEKTVQMVRAALDEATFTLSRQQGREMTLEQAEAFALREDIT